MAAVFQQVNLTWNGEEYSITPDMSLIQRIEQKYSLSLLANRVSQGEPPLSHVAGVVTIMLRSAGADVDEGDVYTTMFAEGSDFIMSVTSAILAAAFPEMPGNVEAPTASGAKAKPKKSTTKK